MTDRPLLFSAEMVRAILAGTKTMTRRLLTPSTSYLGSSTWDELDWSAPWREPDRSVTAEQIAAAMERPPQPPKPRPFDYMKPDRGSPENFFCPYPGTEYLHVPAKDGETRHRVYPRIKAGNRLWVKETWRCDAWDEDGGATISYRADGATRRAKAPDADALCEQMTGIAERAGWEEVGGGMCGTEDIPVLPWRPSIFMPRWASRITLEVTGVRVERLQAITEEDARAEGVTPWPEPRIGLAQGFPHVGAFSDLWDKVNLRRGSWASNPLVWVVSFRRAP